ncbi:MAG: hypothetical protein Q8L55_00925 [Phycisphaerales bacterium]|nr:hypothetical protein [Phycisphaerales bacterium]
MQSLVPPPVAPEPHAGGSAGVAHNLTLTATGDTARGFSLAPRALAPGCHAQQKDARPKPAHEKARAHRAGLAELGFRLAAGCGSFRTRIVTAAN